MDELNKQINLNSEEGSEVEGPNDKDGTDDIWDAVEKGSLVGVKYYFTKNPSHLDAIEECLNAAPLHLASGNGYLEIAEYLLSESAQVDPKKIPSKKTPLMMACFSGHISIVNLLLEKGADINHQTKKRDTPLHYAVRGNHLDIVKLLIEKGADRTRKNTSGLTPHKLAKYSGGRTPIVEYLISLEEDV